MSVNPEEEMSLYQRFLKHSHQPVWHQQLWCSSYLYSLSSLFDRNSLIGVPNTISRIIEWHSVLFVLVCFFTCRMCIILFLLPFPPFPSLRVGNTLGGMLLPIHSSLLWDGGAFPGPVVGSAWVWSNGAGNNTFRYKRGTQTLIKSIFNTNNTKMLVKLKC